MHAPDPTASPSPLSADQRFLIETLQEATSKGGMSFGFKTSSEARKARRRMYYIVSTMREYNRELFAAVEFKVVGREVRWEFKTTLAQQVEEVDTDR